MSEIQTEFKLDDGALEFRGKGTFECVVDRDWLKVVLSNLIDNAIKYSTQEPEITVLIKKGTKYFHIDVKDNGIGIQPRDQKRIFNKFQRIYNPQSPNVKGTGLGLYWVKEIIKHHGGRISVESTGTGQGSTFRITLPIYKESRQRFINKLLKRSRNK